jgi:hypothetical protein
MSKDDITYYRQRAVIERSRAKDAPTPEIASVHERLADLYENFIATLDRPVANDLGSVQPPHNVRLVPPESP